MRRRASSRQRWLPWGLAVVALAAVWGLTAWVIQDLRAMARENGVQTALDTARAEAAIVDRSLAAGNLLLASMRDWVAERGVQTEEQWLGLARSLDLFDRLRQRLESAPEIASASLIAADGRVVLTSRGYPAPALDLAERDYFREQMEASPPPVSVNARPATLTGRWNLFVARRFVASDGTVPGVLAVGIETSAIGEVSRRDPAIAISLVRPDGRVLTSRGGPAPGTLLPCIDGLRAAVGQRGAAPWDDGACFGTTPAGAAIVALWPSPSLPFLVLVAIPQEVYAGTWWQASGRLIAVAAALSVLILAVGYATTQLGAAWRSLARVETDRQMLAGILDAPLGVAAIVAADGTVSFSNRGFRDLLGDALVNGSLLNSPRIEGAGGLRGLLDGTAPSPQGLDLRVLQAGAPPRVLRVAAARTTLAGYAGVILYGFDETERRLADAALVRASQMITVGEMATGLAHELNQPLNVIKIAAQLARHESGAEAPSPFVAEQLERIARQADRAASLIGHLRLFGRAPEGQTTAVDLRDACRNVDDMVGRSLRAAGLDLVFEIEKRPLPVRGHLVLFEQAMLNLIVNARDALAAGGTPQPRIRVVVGSKGGDRVQVHVHDNGPGVPEAIRDRLFEPFFTTKPVGEGTGLGLAIAYGIAREAGGRLSLCASEGGAVFEIDLPLAA